MTENKPGDHLVLFGNINKLDGVRVNFDTSGNPLHLDGKRFTALELEELEREYIEHSAVDLNKELDSTTTRYLAILANELDMLGSFDKIMWNVNLLTGEVINIKIEKLSPDKRAEMRALIQKLIPALERQGRGSKK